MGAPPESTNNGSDAARRITRAGTTRAARAIRQVVERAMKPKTAELDALIGELSTTVAGIRHDHEFVAEDLRGLHNWLDLRFGELEADTRIADLTKLVEAALQRLDEISAEVRALDRHVRRLADDARPRAAEVEAGSTAATTAAAEPNRSLDAVFDYDAFETQFRGAPDSVFAEQFERYAHLVEGHVPVVDVGCGRGGFLVGLAERGIAGIGVEPNADLAAIARERGLEVHEQLVGDFLRSVPDASLGSIVSFQVVEHLQPVDLIEFVDLAAQKLRPGGVFIAETPNPASWIVLHTSFILDPTHVQPLHPGLLSFLCDRAGLTDIRVEYFAPAESMYVQTPSDDEVPDWARPLVAGFTQLNHLLFGPQDYAVVCRAPGKGSGDREA